MHTHLQTHKLHLHRLLKAAQKFASTIALRQVSNAQQSTTTSSRVDTQTLMQDVAMASFHAQGRIPTFSMSACQRAKADSKELASVSKSMCMTAATQPFHVVHKCPNPINLQKTSWLRQCTIIQSLTSLIAPPISELTGWTSGT